ncbi:MAG: hypothetical protein WC433_05035 [Candidatus Omnitrophota bacterium]
MINSYATLLELKNYLTPRGLSSSNITTDTNDDSIMSVMLEGISRWIDDQTHRTFYPRIETRLFDYPDDEILFLDDDLLSLTTLTNGDSTVITSVQYVLYPKNAYPKQWVKILPSTSLTWQPTDDGDAESAISVLGWWGFHNNYTQRAWSIAGTLGAAMTDTTTTSLTMTAGHTVVKDEVYKIDNEVINVSNVSTNTVTLVARGDNGSTAATHLNGAAVYKWNAQPEMKSALLSICQNVYESRSGQTSQGNVTVTAAGIVIRPGDVSPMTQRTLSAFTRPL